MKKVSKEADAAEIALTTFMGTENGKKQLETELNIAAEVETTAIKEHYALLYYVVVVHRMIAEHKAAAETARDKLANYQKIII